MYVYDTLDTSEGRLRRLHISSNQFQPNINKIEDVEVSDDSV